MPINHNSQLGEIQEAVSVLLEYAVQRSDIDVKDEFLQMTIPLLRKTENELGELDEIHLWSAYNNLSKSAFPATAESIKIANQIYVSGLEIQEPDDEHRHREVQNGFYSISKGCKRQIKQTLSLTIFLLIVYLFVQGDAILVGEAVKKLGEMQTKYTLNHQREDDFRATNPAPIEFPASIRVEKDAIDGIVKMMLLTPGIALDIHVCDSVTNTLGCMKWKAELWLQVLTTLFLPFILGFLGSAASLVRQTLNNLENKSFKQAWPGQLLLRLVLGGLVGELSGVIFAPSLEELQTLKLSLVFVAFLMGYSTNMAFGVFDKSIESVIMVIKPKPKPTEPPK